MGDNRQIKKAGFNGKRQEIANWAVEQRRVRKKENEPGTREHDSNELWMGKENFNHVLDTSKSLLKKVNPEDSSK
jgi:hypothetical protein